GSGKTILTAIVVNDIITRFRSDPKIGVAYIYFNFRQSDDQKVEKLLASLLKQLARSQSFPENVKALHDQHRRKQTRPSADEILKTLQSVAATYSRCLIIVDALDECQPFNECGKRFLSYIFNLQANTATNLFATARPIPDIEAQFKMPLLRRDILASTEDVRLYLDGHMSDLPRCVEKKPDLQEEIKAEIASAVEGMFLLAQLYLDSLKDKTSIKQVKSALEQFKRQRQLGPGEENKRKILEQAYKQAMDRINYQMPGIQVLGKATLAWITCAKRKLTTSELQHALAVEVGSTKFDRDNLPEIEDMVSACAGLVTIDEKSNIIRLVHYTTQEYFERTQQAWFPDAETEITKTCVTYLSSSVFESGVCPNKYELQARLRSNLLYDYAARNWGHHAGAASETRLILDFLKSEANVAASSQVLTGFRGMSYRKHQKLRKHEKKAMMGIHLAAFFGLTSITSWLLDNGHDPNAKDDRRRTPLSWAASNGHEAMMRLLLEHGADIERMDIKGQTPLMRAIRKGDQTTIVQLLLEKGADIEVKDENGQTPFSLAAEKGHEATVRILLDKGVNIDAKDEEGQTPLSLAARKGHEAIVQLLLNKGVDIETKDEDGQTPLSLAVAEEHEAIVQLLLDKGAGTEVKESIFGRTPLSWAAAEGNEAIVRILLDKGVDIEAKDETGETPLSLAAQEGHEAIVRLLLDKGADVEAKHSISGLTPL
ncbi:ankyrin repeat-containing domain protein, partial [Trichoderma austrokoningii]